MKYLVGYLKILTEIHRTIIPQESQWLIFQFIVNIMVSGDRPIINASSLRIGRKKWEVSCHKRRKLLILCSQVTGEKTSTGADRTICGNIHSTDKRMIKITYVEKCNLLHLTRMKLSVYSIRKNRNKF